MSAPTQLANFSEDTLFVWVRLYVLAVGAKARAKPNVSDPLAVPELVIHSVARSLADRLALPLG
jgi:hypothetical protein